MSEEKFKLAEKVFVKSIKKEGTVVGWMKKSEDSIDYKVSVEEVYCWNYDHSAIGVYMAKREEYYITKEWDLESLKPTPNKDEIINILVDNIKAIQDQMDEIYKNYFVDTISTQKVTISSTYSGPERDYDFYVCNGHSSTKIEPIESISIKIDSVCECGKEKHGFASHSTWCGIKEII